MSETSTSAVGPAVAVSRFPEAYARLADKMRALPSDQLTQINIEIPSAVTAVLGALPEIMALRPRMVEELPKFPIEMLDELEASTLAMDYANTMFVMSTRKAEPLPELVERTHHAGEVLRADAQSLALRGLIDGTPLENLRGGNAQRNIAFDVFALAYLLRSNWSAIQGKTALTLAELAEAEQLADRLTTALGLRQQAPNGETPSAEMRQRSYNLFLRNFMAVRRAVQFLCPDTFEEIVPPIHTPRGPAKKRGEEERPAPANTGVHPSVQALAETGLEAAPAAVGMPGASPYTKA